MPPFESAYDSIERVRTTTVIASSSGLSAIGANDSEVNRGVLFFKAFYEKTHPRGVQRRREIPGEKDEIWICCHIGMWMWDVRCEMCEWMSFD